MIFKFTLINILCQFTTLRFACQINLAKFKHARYILYFFTSIQYSLILIYLIVINKIYSETLHNEYIGRIYQMSSWQFSMSFILYYVNFSICERIRHLMNSFDVFVIKGFTVQNGDIFKQSCKFLKLLLNSYL